MATPKETTASRPISGSLPRHLNTARQHSHSVSLGAMKPTHRINRRKSVTSSSTANNAAAALAAALSQGHTYTIPSGSHRRSSGSKKGIEAASMGTPSNMGVCISKSSTDNADARITDYDLSHKSIEEDAVEDGPPVQKSVTIKNRNRRASEGSHLVSGEGKRSNSELRCDTCGKSYKHSSCLTKHMWEHDPAWAVTSKLLISKHQQVQLLEAASVLVNMNSESSSPPDASHIQESEGSSESPGFSGSSELQDELSSAETTPPPMSDATYPVPAHKRFSSGSTGFSRSYRSIPSSSFCESIKSPGLPPYRLPAADSRPTTAGTDDGGLAAAAELLNFGTPRTRAYHHAGDVPPVPPLPERYQTLNTTEHISNTPTIYNPFNMHPPALTQQLSDEREVKFDGDTRGSFGNQKRAVTNHDDDDDMFRMEE